LNEIAEAANIGILIEEEKIPLKDQVSGACEILGLDPLYLANEGKLIAVVDNEFALRILEEMRKNDLGKESEIIGEITAENRGLVTMLTQIGSKRIVDMISGEQLPRIC
jgi:hydrogenase expression/formation protein HypE